MRRRKNNGGGDQERTRAGQPVFRHTESSSSTDVAPPDEAVRAALAIHLDEYLGPISTTFAEIVSEKVRLDILIWNPTPDRPMYTLMTQGMSDLPMTVPAGAVAAGAAQRAELMLCLPPDWTMPSDANPKAWSDPDAYFPVRFMKVLGRLPHEYNTWLGIGHTIPNGDPPEPMSNTTRLCGWLVYEPVTLPPEFARVDVDGVGDVAILSMIALYPDEMQQKLDRGTESLVDGLASHNVTELLDLRRPSVAGSH